MAKMFNVHANVNGEVISVPLESRGNAIGLADHLARDEYITDVHVTDEFTENEDGYPKTIFVPGGQD